MTPFCCEGRGGDQKRMRVREVTEMVKYWGGPLGAERKIINEYWFFLLYQKSITRTILLSDHTGSCCRSSSNTGVSCDATGVAGVWQESTQCGCSLCPHQSHVEYFSAWETQEVVLIHSIKIRWTPAEFDWCGASGRCWECCRRWFWCCNVHKITCEYLHKYILY